MSSQTSASKTKVIIVAPSEIHTYFTTQFEEEWDTQVPVETIAEMWEKLQTGVLSAETSIVMFLDTYMADYKDELSTAIATFAPAALVMVLYYDIQNHPELSAWVAGKAQQSGLTPAKFYPINAAANDLGEEIFNAFEEYEAARKMVGAAYSQAVETVQEEQQNLLLDDEPEEIYGDRQFDYEAFSTMERGLIIASTSSKGGSGKTTVGLCTASMLYHASRLAVEAGLRDKPLRVCIIDMDVRDGQIGFILGKTSPTVLNILVDQARTAEDMEKHIIYDQKLGIHALLAPKRGRTGDLLTPDFYQDVIQKVSTLFDVVVLDTSVNYLDPLLEQVVLPIADAVMFVTNLAVGSVFGMNRWMDEVTTPKEDGGAGIDISKIGVVVNQSAPGLGIAQDLLEQAASGAHLMSAIPLDSQAVISASNARSLDQIVLNHPDISPAYYRIITQLMPDEAFVQPTPQNLSQPTGLSNPAPANTSQQKKKKWRR